MKSNKKSCDFISKFKYFMLIPIVIALLSIVFGAIFGFNQDYDFQDITTFNVKFNTTLFVVSCSAASPFIICATADSAVAAI